MRTWMEEARRLYAKRSEFYEVVDHALENGCIDSNDEYFLLYYKVDKENFNCKKVQNSLDNGEVFYVSLFAGDMKPFLLKNKFKWIAFRRHSHYEKLKCYDYDKFVQKVISTKGLYEI